MAGQYAYLNAYSSKYSDAFSFSANQAALASIRYFTAGLYSERRFMLQQLSTCDLAIAFPAGKGGFGVKASYSGNTLFNTSGIGWAYARRMGKLDLGLQFNYQKWKPATYESVAVVFAEAGAIMQVNDRFRTGIHIYHPAGSYFKKTEEKLPFIYSAGFGFDVSDKLFARADIRKSSREPVSVSAGLQYGFDEKLFARAGMDSGNSAFYFGGGVVIGKFRIDVSATIHQYLGPTPGFMLIYQPLKQE